MRKSKKAQGLGIAWRKDARPTRYGYGINWGCMRPRCLHKSGFINLTAMASETIRKRLHWWGQDRFEGCCCCYLVSTIRQMFQDRTAKIPDCTCCKSICAVLWNSPSHLIHRHPSKVVSSIPLHWRMSNKLLVVTKMWKCYSMKYQVWIVHQICSHVIEPNYMKFKHLIQPNCFR